MVKKKMKSGLGSPNIDPEVKRRIHSLGGKASSGGGRKKGSKNKDSMNVAVLGAHQIHA